MEKIAQRGVVKRTDKISPASMILKGEFGKRIVLNAAKRVINTHNEVIKSLVHDD